MLQASSFVNYLSQLLIATMKKVNGSKNGDVLCALLLCQYITFYPTVHLSFHLFSCIAAIVAPSLAALSSMRLR